MASFSQIRPPKKIIFEIFFLGILSFLFWEDLRKGDDFKMIIKSITDLQRGMRLSGGCVEWLVSGSSPVRMPRLAVCYLLDVIPIHYT